MHTATFILSPVVSLGNLADCWFYEPDDWLTGKKAVKPITRLMVLSDAWEYCEPLSHGINIYCLIVGCISVKMRSSVHQDKRKNPTTGSVFYLVI